MLLRRQIPIALHTIALAPAIAPVVVVVVVAVVIVVVAVAIGVLVVLMLMVLQQQHHRLPIAIAKEAIMFVVVNAVQSTRPDVLWATTAATGQQEQP